MASGWPQKILMDTQQRKPQAYENKYQFLPLEFVVMLVLVFEEDDGGDVQKRSNDDREQGAHMGHTDLDHVADEGAEG